MASFSGRHIGLLLLSCSLTTLIRQTSCSYEPQYVNRSRISFNATGEYKWFPDSSQITQPDYFLSELNFDAISGSIITGAADTLYLLDTELRLRRNLTWETDRSLLSMCSDSTRYACRNHIRVYERIPEDHNRLLVCGTQATVRPQCRTADIAGGTLGDFSTPVTSSNGIVSYYPEFPGFGEFRTTPPVGDISVLVSPSSVTLPEMSNFLYSCFAGSPAVSLAWTFNFVEPLPMNAMPRAVSSVTSQLFIQNVTQSNVGAYFCTATYANGSTETGFAHLILAGPSPTASPDERAVSIAPMTITVPPSADFIYTCVANSPVQSFWWRFNLVEPLPGNAEPRTLSSTVSQLDIRNVSQPNAGAYYCAATFPDGVLRQNFTHMIFQGSNSDSTYFTAGFFDGSNGPGRHFSLSYQSISFGMLNDPNSLQTNERFRTITNNNFWLRFPVTFVDYYKADYPVVSPATLTEHYQFYFVFLRENLFDTSTSSSDTIYSRVVRICRNDPGSTPDQSGASHFTTYLKARIYCEREVPTGREFVGALDYQYNDIRSMVFNEDGRYHENGEWVKTMYGAFSGPQIGPAGSAVCAYRADNSFVPTTGAGGFNRGIFDIFRADVQAGTSEEQNTFVECDPAGRNAVDSEKVLIVQDVNQIGEDPLLVFEDFYIIQMTLDRVCVVRRQSITQCVNQDVLFLGTDTGKVMKVVFGSDGSSGIFPVIVEEIALEDNSTINRMNIEEVNSTKYLFVTTSSRIYRLPLQRCSRHTDCSECIGSRDPYCVWNSTGLSCEESPLSAVDDMTGTVSADLNQNIHTGLVPSVCDYPEIRLSASSYRVTEGAGSVNVVVTATTPGLSGYVTLQTENGNATAGADYVLRNEPVNFSAGQNESVISIGIQDDSTYEGDEVFVVRLMDARVGGVTITRNKAEVVIDNDDVVTMEFGSSALNVSESHCYANVTVVKLGSTTSSVGVTMTTGAGTATAGEDYVYTEVELNFAPEDDAQTVLIPLMNDQVNEPTENFIVTLMLPPGQPGAQLGGDTATLTVMDDDGPTQPPTGTTGIVDVTAMTSSSTSMSSNSTSTSMESTTGMETVFTVQTGGLGDCRAFGSLSVVTAVFVVLVAIIVILVLVVIVLACVLAKKRRSDQIQSLKPPNVLGDLEEPSGSKLNDLPLGVMMNIVYEAETPILTTPPATLCEAKTLASQKTSGIDEQSPEKEDLGASEDQLQCEKDPESTLCRPI